MLHAATADYSVSIAPLFVYDTNTQSLVEVQSQFATVRSSPFDGKLEALGTVKGRYTVLQNAEVLAQALDLVDAGATDVEIDSLGVLDSGRQFYVALRLGPLVIDPNGIADVLHRHIVVRSSHDGSTALTYSNVALRSVGRNTVVLNDGAGQRVHKAKHTPNIEDRLSKALHVLGLSNGWAGSAQRMAEQMLAIPLTSAKTHRVLSTVVPAGTGKSVSARAKIVDEILGLLENEVNVGNNGWALWNAIAEWHDHYRPGNPRERAVTSMDDGSWVTRKKALAQDAILNLI